MTGPPLYQGLDPALVSPLIFYLRTKNYATVEIHFYYLFYHSMYSCKLHENHKASTFYLFQRHGLAHAHTSKQTG